MLDKLNVFYVVWGEKSTREALASAIFLKTKNDVRITIYMHDPCISSQTLIDYQNRHGIKIRPITHKSPNFRSYLYVDFCRFMEAFETQKPALYLDADIWALNSIAEEELQTESCLTFFCLTDHPAYLEYDGAVLAGKFFKDKKIGFINDKQSINTGAFLVTENQQYEKFLKTYISCLSFLAETESLIAHDIISSEQIVTSLYNLWEQDGIIDIQTNGLIEMLSRIQTDKVKIIESDGKIKSICGREKYPKLLHTVNNRSMGQTFTFTYEDDFIKFNG